MATSFETIYDQFLKLIDDPDLALMSDEDLKLHLSEYLKDAIYLYLTPTPKELLDMGESGFNSDINPRLQRIVAHAMVLVWIEPKILKERILRSAIQDRDYSELSHSSQLNALLKVKSESFNKLHEFIIDYFYQDDEFQGLS